MQADERTCPECAETIKKAAAVCKHCGHRFRSASISNGPRNEAEQKVANNSKIGCAVVVVALIGFLSFCTPDTPTTDAERPSSRAEGKADENPFDDVSKQQLWIVKSEDGIKSRLKDPDSADFRDVSFYSGGTTPVVCGEVNAKNAFGGFTGFERFIASGETLAFLESDMTSASEMTDAWNKLCVKSPRDKARVR